MPGIQLLSAVLPLALLAFFLAFHFAFLLVVPERLEGFSCSTNNFFSEYVEQEKYISRQHHNISGFCLVNFFTFRILPSSITKDTLSDVYYIVSGSRRVGNLTGRILVQILSPRVSG